MTTVTLAIDGRTVTVPAGSTILDAAKAAGTDIPHFCYHPGLSIAGNCRMCLVELEKTPKPVIACKTPAAEGQSVRTATEEVKRMQRSVMEFLLLNHPLDCPTCDQAGECRLQDYYMAYDALPSRTREKKVRKKKMTDLGAKILLDEERCIVCTRCVRFCDEIAGIEELYVQERGNRSMVAAFPGKGLKNPYAGCVVDVCPVGALTSKDFRYKKRVWFLETANSVCPGCSRGCNIGIAHNDRTVYRLKPRFNPEVNSYWMCDEGRYGYKFVNEHRRLRPAVRESSGLKDASRDEAVAYARLILGKLDPRAIAYVASAMESNEAIESFAEFARSAPYGGAPAVYYSKNESENPFSDDILITSDKNPNLAHALKLGLKPLAELHAGTKALVVQRDLSLKDLSLVRAKALSIPLAFTTNACPVEELSRVILPVPTFAEQSGHYTNVQGKVQRFVAAFEPRGEAAPVMEYLAELARPARFLERT